MVTIISYNVNGIRSAISKGFVEWLSTEMPDIIHIQEVKAMREQVDVTAIEDLGYHIYWFPAHKKGYSGVATFTKIKPNTVKYGISHDFFDTEGRFLQLDFDDFSTINSYFPSGSNEMRQEIKEEYLEIVLTYCNELQKTNKNLIVSGDYNICHKAIDINHPERHTGYSGFLPQEREWMDRFVESGFVDSFRVCNNQPQQYSWWSYRAGARPKNLGWRIDYNMVSAALSHKITSAFILPQVVHSDHCPVVVKIDM